MTCTFLVFSNSMIRPSVSALVSKRTDRPQGVTMGETNPIPRPPPERGPVHPKEFRR